MALIPDAASNKIRPVAIWVIVLMVAVPMMNREFGQVVAQQVSFSHKTHVSDFEISCRFCHYFANRSTKAGVPSLSDCLDCHRMVRGSEQQQQDEILQLDQLWLTKRPLVWIKINDLPDFVFFTHQAHTRLGFTCERCHGDVASQTEVADTGRIQDLTMSWCLECHSEKHRLDGMGQVVSSDPTVDLQTKTNDFTIRQGSIDCQSCHR